MDIKVTDIVEFGGGYVRGKVIKIENDSIDVECQAVGLNKNDVVVYPITKDMVMRIVNETTEKPISMH